MRVFSPVTGLGLALGLALLPGCSAYNDSTTAVNRGTSSFYGGIAAVGDAIGMPWGGMRPGITEESLTEARVRGGPMTAEPLAPEAGNVWPAPEERRTTMLSPDQALRGIPAFNSSALGERPPQPVTAEPAAPGRGTRRGAGGPFVPAPASEPLESPRPQSGLQPLPPVTSTLGQAYGQPIQTPRGAIVPATSAGNTGTFTSPGGGGGTITRDGNNALISRPGEAPQSVQIPR